MSKVSDILINPEKSINKKSYTPHKIYEDLYHYDLEDKTSLGDNGHLLRSYKSEYKLSDLVSFLIQQNEKDKLEELLNDYPYAVDITSGSSEKPIFKAILNKNLEIFNMLKEKGAKFDSLDFDYMNVYENALIYPIFWPLVYGELSSEQIYQKITKTESDIYNDGCFEFLFRSDDYSLNVLKEFKQNYPQVFNKIIKENSNNNKIKNATGEVLRIILDYDSLEKDLIEHFDNRKDTAKENYLKF